MTTNPFEMFPEDMNNQSGTEKDQVILAETVLTSLRMGEALQMSQDILPTTKQYQLAITADQIPIHDLSLPQSFFNLIDPTSIHLVIITYNFGSPQDRPFLEVRLETKENVIVTISKPGIDLDEPYSGSAILNGKDYSIPIPAEEVADLIAQIVVPSLDGIPLSDPQNPSQARSIIDTLVQSQQADMIESQLFELTVPKSDEYDEATYEVRLHAINGDPNEIEIETILDNTMTFDVEVGIPIHHRRALNATLSFDDFSQSVSFSTIESGKEPEKLPNDAGLLNILDEAISRISKLVDDDPNGTNTISLDESF
ncbi:MAG: hypothetical protein JWO61_12 [Candidatus Saccharibacteria bacterium]|nr:hypothetical protein [Candidatus Saccharibacteria bacterium]